MTELEHIKASMVIMADRAEQLYQGTKRDCPGMPTPIQWILTQAFMRASWERFYATTNKKPDPLRSMLLGNPYSKYMRFMYESYPPGFGDEIRRCFAEGKPFDGAVVYYHLTRGTD